MARPTAPEKYTLFSKVGAAICRQQPNPDEHAKEVSQPVEKGTGPLGSSKTLEFQR
jgi:hypothetical protein